MFELAERHKDFRKEVFEKVMLQEQSLVENNATKESRQVYNWNRQVAGCYQRSRAFTRLGVSEHGIVYCKVEPEHYVEDMLARWFLSRFPKFIVVVSSSRGTFIARKNMQLGYSNKSHEEVIKELEKGMPKNSILSEIKDFDEEEWNQYYDSQFIKQRKNTPYFLKNIPKKFHDWEGLKHESRKYKGNMALDEFMER